MRVGGEDRFGSVGREAKQSSQIDDVERATKMESMIGGARQQQVSAFGSADHSGGVGEPVALGEQLIRQRRSVVDLEEDAAGDGLAHQRHRQAERQFVGQRQHDDVDVQLPASSSEGGLAGRLYGHDVELGEVGVVVEAAHVCRC